MFQAPRQISAAIGAPGTIGSSAENKRSNPPRFDFSVEPCLTAV